MAVTCRLSAWSRFPRHAGPRLPLRLPAALRARMASMQTVWLEPVPATHVASLTVTPDPAAAVVRVVVHASEAAEGLTFRVRAHESTRHASGTAGTEAGASQHPTGRVRSVLVSASTWRLAALLKLAEGLTAAHVAQISSASSWIQSCRSRGHLRCTAQFAPPSMKSGTMATGTATRQPEA